MFFFSHCCKSELVSLRSVMAEFSYTDMCCLGNLYFVVSCDLFRKAQ